MADAIPRMTIFSIAFANLAGVAFLLGSAALALPDPRGDYSHGEVLAADIAAGFVIFVIASVITLRRVERAYVRIRPLVDGFAVDHDARACALSYAWRRAADAGISWVVAAAIIGPLDIRFYGLRFEIVEIVWGILLPGVVATALTFFLVERALQPVLPRAVEDAQAWRHRPAVLPRLVGSWLLGSGIWFVIIFLAPIGRGRSERAELAPYLWFVCLMGIAAGLIMIVVVGRGLSGRLEMLRRAQQRVHAGDLDVSVTVDDAGDVGLLQAGFNEMVEGLRERRRIEQLFGTYVGLEAAQYALEHGTETGGELREVSVLFVDVVDSTGLAQGREPTQLVSMLNALFEAVVRVIEDHDGWIDKFEGDAALCVFGAPIAQPDHAARALHSARCLREEALILGRTWPGLDVGIGVSTGTAVAGNVGAKHRHEYTVIGVPVNEAARLSEAAKRFPQRVLASATTFRDAGDEASQWKEIGEVTLRGRKRPTIAYEPGDAPAGVTEIRVSS
jgi:adenylate cyclase